MLVVQLRQEAVASPSFCRVQGLGPPDQKTVEGDRQGVCMGVPEGTGGQVAMG